GVFKLSVVGLACAPFLPTMDQCEAPGPGIASHFLPTALNKKDVALGGPAKPLSKSGENPPLRHYPCRLWHLADQHGIVRKVRSRVEIGHWFSANPRVASGSRRDRAQCRRTTL